MCTVSRFIRALVALATCTLTACGPGSTATTDGPLAALKIIHLLQGVDNAQIGFVADRALATVTFPSIAPTEDAAYLFTAADGPRKLLLLLPAATILDSTLTLVPNTFYTIVTTGTRGASGTAAPQFVILQNDMTRVLGGNVRFRFIHGAVASGPVDVHIRPDTGGFAAATRFAAAVPFRGGTRIEAPVGGNRTVCVIGAGVLPTPNGSNCRALRSYGVPPGAALTAVLRDPVGTETTPGILFTLDRTP